MTQPSHSHTFALFASLVCIRMRSLIFYIVRFHLEFASVGTVSKGMVSNGIESKERRVREQRVKWNSE